jgi:hypothetical protein
MKTWLVDVASFRDKPRRALTVHTAFPLGIARPADCLAILQNATTDKSLKQRLTGDFGQFRIGADTILVGDNELIYLSFKDRIEAKQLAYLINLIGSL